MKYKSVTTIFFPLRRTDIRRLAVSRNHLILLRIIDTIDTDWFSSFILLFLCCAISIANDFLLPPWHARSSSGVISPGSVAMILFESFFRLSLMTKFPTADNANKFNFHYNNSRNGDTKLNTIKSFRTKYNLQYIKEEQSK